MTMLPVPSKKEKTDTVRVKRTNSRFSAPFQEDWEVVEGGVEVIAKSDVSNRWLDSTETILRLSEGAIIKTTRIDMWSKTYQREYTVKDGVLYYKMI